MLFYKIFSVKVQWLKEEDECLVWSTGSNPSALNGVKIPLGEKVTAHHGDIIEVWRMKFNARFQILFYSSSNLDFHIVNTLEMNNK